MPEQFTHGYALLIGINDNLNPAWALPDVAKDVTALAEVLAHPARCAYPQDHIKTLLGKEATRNNILAGFSWLRARIAQDPEATVVIYYTGHGWQDKSTTPPDYYFIPYDIQADQAALSALPAAAFAKAVRDLQPKRLLVVLDCCHASGMAVKGDKALPDDFASAAPVLELFVKDALASLGASGSKGFETLAQGQGRAVLNSSTSTQSSYIRKDRTMSAFTYHLIEALTGHAQPQTGATEVLVTDVMSYVHRTVPASVAADYPGYQQQPECQMSGNFPVALLLGGKGLSKDVPAPNPLAPLPTSGAAVAFNQTGQTVHGPQTNIGGNVTGTVMSGNFQGPVNIGDIKVNGQISGSGISIGHGTQHTTNITNNTTVADSQPVALALAALQAKIQALSPRDRTEADDAVKHLQAELRETHPDTRRLDRTLSTLDALLPGARAQIENALQRGGAGFTFNNAGSEAMVIGSGTAAGAGDVAVGGKVRGGVQTNNPPQD